MKRLFHEGRSLSEIARSIGCHRQTVRLHLREKHRDIVADEVRKQVLVEELRNHYQQLGKFAQEDLRLRLDASGAHYEKLKSGQTRAQNPIFAGGTIALPDMGGSTHRYEEWLRMYRPSLKDKYLLDSLREHIKESPFWIPWDRWRSMVLEYETASQALFEWLEGEMEAELFEKINPAEIELYRSWIFGNILLTAGGLQPESLEDFRQEFVYVKGVIIAHDPSSDDGKALYEYLYGILEEAQQRAEWAVLRSATEQLKQKESQLELGQLAKDIDYALAGIELMNAFPGHCSLCPV